MSAPDWTRAAAEFDLSATMWHALADQSHVYNRPELGVLAADFSGEIAHLYRRMAQTAESFGDRARELAFASRLQSVPCAGDAA